MKRLLGRSGVAAVEMALLAPFLVTLTIGAIDFGAAFYAKALIGEALASSAEYATLAGQNTVASATIVANAKTIAGSVSNAFVGTAITTAVINQNNGTGSKCCIGSGTWSCSTSSGFTCTDGSSPGVYITITAQYPFNALFSADTYLTGRTFSDSIVAPLQ
jgi:Flp pilus assembly protein TadG